MKKVEVVVVFLTLCLLVPSASAAQPRLITVRVLVDGTDDIGAIYQPLNAAFFTASNVFQQFGIQFQIVELAYGGWFAPSDNFDGPKALTRISQMQFPKKVNIVVAFTTKKFFSDGEIEVDGITSVARKQFGGLATGKFALIGIQYKFECVLIHELGHLFGADHSSDPRSVMNAKEIKTLVFDQKSKEVILANLNRKF